MLHAEGNANRAGARHALYRSNCKLYSRSWHIMTKLVHATEIQNVLAQSRFIAVPQNEAARMVFHAFYSY